MFSVANFHKVTLFQQFFPCCYFISFLTHYFKLFTFLIPKVISPSAGREPPSPFSYILTLQATEKSIQALMISNKGAIEAHPLLLSKSRAKAMKLPPPAQQNCSSNHPITFFHH